MTEKMTTSQVAARAGVPPTTLIRWSDEKFLRPTGAARRRKGEDRVYRALDVICVKVARDLLEVGLSKRAVGEVIAAIQSGDEERCEHALLVTVRGTLPTLRRLAWVRDNRDESAAQWLSERAGEIVEQVSLAEVVTATWKWFESDMARDLPPTH